ncbi:L-idonate 5-dehydrogenase [Propionibacterium cyclohexanicum]|uniref:L-idonate 5-dehydrogenase n=2 Tax=Propionibacterium cyclohexanicum TaxID=64702 RepID=A0A1H9T7X7_9ACTN|nr:L-idonate 5-dehydrogenase [Propionibacterium cyclohexanicum]
MTAVVAHGAGDMRLEQRPIPEPAPGEVLVRVAYVGVCGSDLGYYRAGRVGAFAIREPLVVGHEVVGRVETDPSGTLAAGTAVAVHPATPGEHLPGLDGRPNIWPQSRYLGSAATLPHTQGAMSQFFSPRADQLRVLPDGLPLDRAVLAEPLGVALHAINRAGGVGGRRLLVSGAGPVGLLVAGAAKALGARHVAVVDLFDEPLARARQVGADEVFRSDRDALPTGGFETVIECSGAPAALTAALDAAAWGATVVQVGILPGDARPVALAPLIAREIDLRGSFRFIDEIDHAITLLAENPSLGHVITDVFDARDAVAAFDRASDSRASAKVAVRFDTPASKPGVGGQA